MGPVWWDVLSDGELRARLLNRLGGPGNEARARWLVEQRDDEDAQGTITEILD